MRESPMDYDPERSIEWVTVRNFYLDTQASFFAAKLEAAGIPTFVASNLIGSIIPMGDGGIRLQVPKHELEAALEVISEIKAREEEAVDWDFRDATHEDIEYEKALHQPKNRPYYLIIAALVIAIIVILLRIFSRATGLVPSWLDPF